MPHQLTSTSAATRWARPLALSVWLSAAVLVAFGGAITTLRAGMAIDGWWVLDRGAGDHFLLAYPLEKWFATSGTFAEHTHRLVGVLVGLLSIAYALLRTFEKPRSGFKLALAWSGLLAVCLQGAVGGFRVLENSPELAFLHGALAQLVFALLGANVVVSAAAWNSSAGTAARDGVGRLARTAWLTAAVLYLQIVLGAWLRHAGVELALTLHIVVAAFATGAVVSLARSLRRASAHAAQLAALGARLAALLVAQLALGLTTLAAIFVVSGGFTAEVSGAETLSATLHVLVGALLLQQTVAAAMWCSQLAGAGAAQSSAASSAPSSVVNSGVNSAAGEPSGVRWGGAR
jgi:cytochrome c oxidase assembly protein subunit 15